ncbi:universal stress protein [Patiriisocius marinus]|uniref:Universal stress protein UspA n=1 Tax=Patiriisocius marinus TaxID=1397112 RepID=A0A5J4IXB8_9FLAO|nr:universal stress protein [Patiriisocius marinus]GER58103.1 universal stress protein UspA [Patiriisocius marinus]
MKTIIVPVDFSEYSENALKVAAQIAKKQNAELVAVHMMGLSEANLTKESDTMEGVFFVKLTQKRFEELLDKDYLEGLTIHTTVKNYKIFSELDDVAQEYEADLIVMGSHGSSGFQEVFVGSNTEKVVRSSKVPVLVIKGGDTFTPTKAVFACDYKTESIVSFKKAMSFFESLNIEVKNVFINQPGEQYLSTKEIDQRIVDFIVQLTGYKLLPEDVAIYSDYNVERGIFNYAKKVKADIIGIPTHGRRGLAHFFTGSIGEDVVNHSKLPVLTVKI